MSKDKKQRPEWKTVPEENMLDGHMLEWEIEIEISDHGWVSIWLAEETDRDYEMRVMGAYSNTGEEGLGCIELHRATLQPKPSDTLEQIQAWALQEAIGCLSMYAQVARKLFPLTLTEQSH